MSKKLSFDLEMNARGFKQGINEAKNATAQYTNATRDLDKETKEYMSDLGSLSKQLEDARIKAHNLAVQFNTLSDAEKKMEFGENLGESMQIAIHEAAELQKVMKQVNDQINQEASDRSGWDAFNEGLQLAKSMTLTLASATKTLTGNEKELANLVKKLTMIENGFNAVKRVGLMLRGSSKTLRQVELMQEAALTRARELSTQKTIGATIAQRAFNAVAKANPYVVIASAIITVTAAIAGFVLATDKANKVEDEQLKKLKDLNDRWADNKKKIGESVGSVLGKYVLLREEYKTLTSEHQKTEWVKNCKDKFDELGLSINNVNDAEQAFIEKSPEVVEALEAQMQAAAMYQVLLDEVANYIKNGGDVNDLFKEEQQESDRLVNALQKQKQGYADLGKEMSNLPKNDTFGTDAIQSFQQPKNVEPVKIETDADKINKGMHTYIDLLSTAQQKTQALHDLIKGNSNTSSKGIQRELTVYEKLQAEVKKYQKALENVEDPYSDAGKDLVKDLTQKLNEAKQVVKDYELAVGIKVENPKSRLDELKEQLKQAEAELPFAVSDEDVQAAWDKINGLKESIENEEVRLHIKVEPPQDDSDLDKIKDILNEPINTPDKKYSFDFLPDYKKLKKDGDAAQALYDGLIKKRDALNEIMQHSKSDKAIADAQHQLDKLNPTIVAAKDNLDSLITKAKDIEFKKKAFDGIKSGIKTLGDLNGAAMQLHDTWASLSENWDDMSGFEKITKTFDAIISTIEDVIGAYESINSVIELFGDISEAASAKKIAANAAEAASDTTTTAIETANSEVKVTANETEKSSDIGKLGVKEAGAIAGATEAGSSLPFPANLVAIAAGIAAVVAAFAMVFSCFAEGGIVPGNSFQGDKVMARLNSGEMVLNSRQQKRLFDIANGIQGGAYAAQTVSIEGKIRGKDLLLVQKNTNTINSVAGQSIKIQ